MLNLIVRNIFTISSSKIVFVKFTRLLDRKKFELGSRSYSPKSFIKEVVTKTEAPMGPDPKNGYPYFGVSFVK